MSAVAADRWHFLTTSLPELLEEHEARIEPAPGRGDDFMCGIRSDAAGLVIDFAAGLEPLERDLSIRGVLARWFGADVSDWPVAMTFRAPQPGAAA